MTNAPRSITDVEPKNWYQIGFAEGAASRDAEVADLLEANRIACEDLVEQQNLRVKYAGQIEELAAALKPFGAIDLVESRLECRKAGPEKSWARSVGYEWRWKK